MTRVFHSLRNRRYLRARKFDVQGAIGQFTDTEKWMKEQEIEDLYEHFDVDFFERARTLVSCPRLADNSLEADEGSILNGQVTVTSEAFPSTSMKSKAWIERMSTSIRKSQHRTKLNCRSTRACLRHQNCYHFSHCITIF